MPRSPRSSAHISLCYIFWINLSMSNGHPVSTLHQSRFDSEEQKRREKEEVLQRLFLRTLLKWPTCGVLDSKQNGGLTSRRRPEFGSDSQAGEAVKWIRCWMWYRYCWMWHLGRRGHTQLQCWIKPSRKLYSVVRRVVHLVVHLKHCGIFVQLGACIHWWSCRPPPPTLPPGKF